jgi:hypothetical protein
MNSNVHVGPTVCNRDFHVVAAPAPWESSLMARPIGAANMDLQARLQLQPAGLADEDRAGLPVDQRERVGPGCAITAI